jgi:polysaccharide export outer membrane protein
LVLASAFSFKFSLIKMTFQLLKFTCVLLILLFANLAHAEPKDASYVLRPNDTVRLAVYEEPDLLAQVRILKTGQASFPLIGSVEIGGMGISAAAAKIRELYAKDYLVDPKLTLTVDEYATDYISVIGEVKQPGQFSIPQAGDLDLGSAMASAGGVTPTADVNAIQLVRSSGGSTTYSLAAIQGAAGRTKLSPGDRVIVTESRFVKKFVTILGPVGKPGAIPFPVDGRLDLVTAIAMAGGLSELANSKKVSINRGGRVTTVDFREISERGDHPYFLQPDDVVTIAERLF